MATDLERADCLSGAQAIWSMWPGYLQRPSEKRYLEFLERHGIPMAIHHASGHAYVDDLKQLAAAIAPKRLVPIHSFAPDHFADLFGNVEAYGNGEWWAV